MNSPWLNRSVWTAHPIFRTWTAVFLILLIAAFVLRSALFNDPLPGDDEQFYLLVGDRMLHGAAPYVEIWDRKPYCLFLIFAGIRLLGGDGMFVAHIVATIVAALTAFMVALIAGRTVARGSAIAAGFFYLLMIGMLGGDSWQAGVFYNLLTATAAWLVLETRPALDGPFDGRRAFGAMALLGVAIQIKTNAAFEGIAIGLWLMLRMFGKRSMSAIVARAALYSAIGLAPTILVGIGFYSFGHFSAWWFANFQSQMLKAGGFGPASLARLPSLLLICMPIAIGAIIGLLKEPRGDQRNLLLLWTIATVIDALAIGNFWFQYAHPFVLVGAILSAHLFAIPRKGPVAFAILSIYPMSDALYLDRVYAANARRIAGWTMDNISPDVRHECMLIYEAPVIYYHLAQACLVTPYIFIDQLRSSAEIGALPIDPATAMIAALDKKPGVIITVNRSPWQQRNLRNDAILKAALARLYTPIATNAATALPPRFLSTTIWRRRDLAVASVR